MINDMSLNGFKPMCWGSSLWHSLHIISFSYPENVPNTLEGTQLKNDTYNFFKLLGSMLPCGECKSHYKKNFEQLNLMASLDSRSNFTKFVYNLHNLVNEETGVPRNQWPTYQDVFKKYDSLRSKDCSSDSCGSVSDNDMKCKVSLVPNNEVEGFSNTGSLNMFIGLFLIICLIGLGIYFYSRQKNSVKHYRR